MMTTISYGMTTRVPISCDRAVEAVTEALKNEGFGILTTIDVRKTMKEKVGADFGYYVILGACNPAFAFATLQEDAEAGLLLPCNVSVRGEGEGCVVSILDPELMAKISGKEGMLEVAKIARKKLERVLEEVKGVTG
jgi:uncharacterized protein (DUF302 family)